MIEQSNKLQLHYFFKGDSHSIDALTRNECEKELLHIFGEISTSLGFNIRIESEPSQKGGFKEVWRFLGQNAAQITIIVSVSTLFISRFPVQNKELTKLQIENLKLDNEIKKRQLQKLNLEFIKEEEVDEQKITDVVEHLQSNYKIAWRKSNFYKKVINYRKVETVSVQRFKETNKVGSERVVERKQFPGFILKSDELPNLEVPVATIDIISPALKSGRFRWKGFYENEIINFEMQDSIFKSDVLKGNVHFSKSFSIEASMIQIRKIDQDGGIKVTNNIVVTVLAIIDNGVRIETEHGKGNDLRGGSQIFD
ncbi:hypothetical protein [Reichenbachiella sp. MALMAid0571]|uniref:hypothetical protein n=1 Tax=Reichenbachiella sp. MALMAid0571 TaxID=3143939 RepID=UPI0032DECB91